MVLYIVMYNYMEGKLSYDNHREGLVSPKAGLVNNALTAVGKLH